jgi:hypothetical protein
VQSFILYSNEAAYSDLPYVNHMPVLQRGTAKDLLKEKKSKTKSLPKWI